MRRLLATAVLLSVTITPALHVWCEWSCADEAASPAETSCHNHGDDGLVPSIADRHDCGSHETEPAVVAKAPHVDASGMAPVVSAGHPASPRDASTSAIVGDFSPPDTSPPPIVAPLRL